MTGDYNSRSNRYNNSQSIVTLSLTKQVYKKKFAYYNLYSKPYAMTYGQWTAKWWQWVFSLPAGINPITDKTGKYANVNQPSDNVWFLAGKFAAEDKEFPKRKCRVPSNRAILFPVINCEANQFEYPHLKTDSRSNKLRFERMKTAFYTKNASLTAKQYQ